MKRCVLALALIWITFAMSACVKVTYGPSDTITDANYVQSAQAAVDDKETIRFMDKGYMLANTANPGPAQTWGVFGTIVVTDKTLYFLFWNRNTNAFDILRKLPVADMADVTHISSAWGPGDYVSIKDKERRFDLFSCFEIYTTANVVEKNRVLLQSLSTVRNAK